MAVKWRERKGRRRRREGKEGVGWKRSNENERAGDGRKTDRKHQGGREMVNTRQSKGLTREQ